MRAAVVLMFVTLACATLSANPFITPAGRGSTDENNGKTRVAPAVAAPRVPALIESQRRLQARLASLMNEIREGRSPKAFALLMLVSLGYGFLHALGPGHRKTVVFSYFLQEDAQLGVGLTAGVAMAGLHGISAVVTVLAIYGLVRTSIMAVFQNVSLVVEVVSYGAIALFGLVLLFLRVREVVRGDAREKVGPHGAEAAPHSRGRRTSLAAMVLSAGVVPCPGAAMIMLFAISMQAVMIGVAAALVMSVGMAITVSLVSVLTILARERALRLVSRHGRLEAFVHHGIEIFGAALVAGFGVLFLLPFLFG